MYLNGVNNIIGKAQKENVSNLLRLSFPRHWGWPNCLNE